MKTAWPVLLFALALLLPAAAIAQTIIQHIGANDPVDQGFFRSGSGNAQVSPVFEDLGLDAWSIAKTVGGTYIYRYDPTPQIIEDAVTNGWILSGRVRFVEPGIGALSFVIGNQSSFLELWMRESGNVEIRHRGDTLYTISDGGQGYQEFSVVYNAIDAVASVWVTGVGKVADLTGGAPEGGHIAFGTGQGSAHVHWNEVTFSIIPEPATAALLAGAGVLLAVGVARGRNRASG